MNSTKIITQLHWAIPLHQNHICWPSPTTSLEQFLRAIWAAVSWAAVLILSQIKFNSQLLRLTSFLSWQSPKEGDIAWKSSYYFFILWLPLSLKTFPCSVIFLQQAILIAQFIICLIKHSESESEVAQSWHPTLRDPMDCSLPGSSIHGIFQARVLEWVAISFSR